MRIAPSGEGDGAAARIVLIGAWGAIAIVALALVQHLAGPVGFARSLPLDLAPNPLTRRRSGSISPA